LLKTSFQGLLLGVMYSLLNLIGQYIVWEDKVSDTDTGVH